MKFLIASANGYGNTGDDLIAVALQRLVKDIDKEAEITLTRPPFDSSILAPVQIVIVGGGGLLYDYDKSGTNVENYLAYVDAAHDQDKPVGLIGVGEQGIFTDKAKQRYRQTLGKADVITVRSQQDADVLAKDVGLTKTVDVLEDLVFTFKPKQSSLLSRLKARPAKPRLAFSLANLARQGLDAKQLGAEADTALNNYDKYINSDKLAPLFTDFKVVLVCQSRDDLPLYQKLSKQYDAELFYPENIDQAEELFSVYARCDLVLTSRFHGLVAAALLGKPVLATGLPDQKVDKLIRERLPSLKRSFFSLQEFVDDDLASKVGELCRGRKLRRSRRREVAKAHHLALKNRAAVKQLYEKAKRLATPA